jgi:hypothetical protein
LRHLHVVVVANFKDKVVVFGDVVASFDRIFLNNRAHLVVGLRHQQQRQQQQRD